MNTNIRREVPHRRFMWRKYEVPDKDGWQWVTTSFIGRHIDMIVQHKSQHSFDIEREAFILRRFTEVLDGN